MEKRRTDGSIVRPISRQITGQEAAAAVVLFPMLLMAIGSQPGGRTHGLMMFSRVGLVCCVVAFSVLIIWDILRLRRKDVLPDILDLHFAPERIARLGHCELAMEAVQVGDALDLTCMIQNLFNGENSVDIDFAFLPAKPDLPKDVVKLALQLAPGAVVRAQMRWQLPRLEGDFVLRLRPWGRSVASGKRVRRKPRAIITEPIPLGFAIAGAVMGAHVNPEGTVFKVPIRCPASLPHVEPYGWTVEDVWQPTYRDLAQAEQRTA